MIKRFVKTNAASTSDNLPNGASHEAASESDAAPINAASTPAQENSSPDSLRASQEAGVGSDAAPDASASGLAKRMRDYSNRGIMREAADELDRLARELGQEPHVSRRQRIRELEAELADVTYEYREECSRNLKLHTELDRIKHAANESNRILGNECERLRDEVAWVKDVLAEHGYVGPLAPACCPLADWIKK